MGVMKKDHWQLTPHPARNCWKKKRDGQTHYVGYGSVRYNEAEYQRAWDEWEKKLADIEAAERAERKADAIPRILEIVDNNERPDPDELNRIGWPLEPRLAAILRRQRDENDKTLRPDELAYMMEQFHKRADAADAAGKGKRPPTLKDLADLFLNRKAAQARKGERSGGRYANLRTFVNQFVTFMGPDTKPRHFHAAIELSKWYDHQDGLIDAGDITEPTASDRMQATRQFIKWLWEQNHIAELPRNLNSKEMTFSRVPGNVEPMPVDVLRRRVKTADGRMKLELLLMANCGMTQKDTADLLHTEVDWKAGTITRKRSKKTKGKEKNLPTVTWYLWPTTLDLLRELASTDSPNVLPNRNGVASVRSDVRDDGTVARTDNARTAYDRLQDSLAKVYAQEIERMDAETVGARMKAGELKMGEDGKPQMRRWSLKHVRKASATAIGNHRDYGRYAQYFLGQAPDGVAATHYVRPSEEQFKACCQWLGQYLDLDDPQKIGLATKGAVAGTAA